MNKNQQVAAAKKEAEAQVAAQRRRHAVTWGLVVIVVLGLLAALIAFIVRQGDVTEISGEGQLTPQIASDNNGFGVAKSGVVGDGLDEAPVRLDVYFDFMCPACASFEYFEAPYLDELRASGDVVVYYHPLANLDRASAGSQFSTRSASAAALIAEEAPDAFVAFVAEMFVNQPAQGTPGLSDDEIVEIALKAGVPENVANRIPNREYTSWARVASEQAARDGIPYTPAVVLDGVLQDPQSDPNAFNWTASETALRDEILRRAAEAS